MPDPRSEHIQLTKLDTVKRQIETALGLWFHNGDPISIHTLAAAAHRVVGDVAELSGRGSVLTDSKFLQGEGYDAKALKKLIREPETFFKHAVEDPHETYTFDTQSTQYILYATIDCYWRLVPGRSLLTGAFMFWMHIHSPQTLTEAARNHFGDLFTSYKELTRPEFLRECGCLSGETANLILFNWGS